MSILQMVAAECGGEQLHIVQPKLSGERCLQCAAQHAVRELMLAHVSFIDCVYSRNFSLQLHYFPWHVDIAARTWFKTKQRY